nr:MAG: putative RNA-dependent RNA polymerase [Xinjiang botourmia-like virus 19]
MFSNFTSEHPAPVKPSLGSGRQSHCSCRRTEHTRREAIARGLKVIRTKFSVPELPSFEADKLDSLLLHLLSPGKHSIRFPRAVRGVDHDGFPIFFRLGRLSRWELATSVASIKRGLTSGTCAMHPPESAFESWASKACPSKPPTSSKEYLQFARKVAREVFQYGWDRTYHSFCDSFSPDSSTRFSRDQGKADLWWAGNSDKETFLREVKTGRFDPIEGMKLRYSEVPAVGKVRAMGIPSVDYDRLGPLHKTMYEHLATKDWLLRGTPTPNRIRSVCRGAQHTSVDFSSATDNLKLDVTEAILGVALSKSKYIPGGIKLAAHDALYPAVYTTNEINGEWPCRFVSHGQMMGTYTSFPLLCMQSYVAARWATRNCKTAGILVNGDDTLISSERRILPEDYPEGFILNRKKTMWSSTAVELNSTQFLKVGGGRWREVRGLRRGAWYVSHKGNATMAAACLRAGNRWLDAFCKIYTHDKKKVLLSSCGVLGKGEAFFQLEKRMMKKGSYWKREEVKTQESRFDLLDIEPTYGDRVGFWHDLFNAGREGGEGSTRVQFVKVPPVRDCRRPIYRFRNGVLSIDPLRSFKGNCTYSWLKPGYEWPVRPSRGKLYSYSRLYEYVGSSKEFPIQTEE